MCGIVGIGGLRDQELVQTMNRSLIHRGPDSEGYHVAEGISLGMRRLKIIDLATGDQPIANEDGSIWTVFNGEIYNYVELREALIKKGHRFKTQSDTEVLVHLYEEKGDGMLADLRGMFAFALWSEREKKLLVARDRFGIKPLFYTQHAGRFYFASEMKALLNVPGISREIDFEALAAYFRFLYIPAPRSIFSGIKKLLPAHYLIYRQGQIETHAYWDLSHVEETQISFPKAKEKYEALLKESMRLHLRTDVPWGIFLSGGMDSSTVATMVREVTTQTLHTFSIGFEEAAYNDLPVAREVARQLESQHEEMVLRPEEAWILPSLVRSFDEPFADASAIPTYFVSRLARTKVTVALSGEGGDDTLSGYPWHYATLLAHRISHVPGMKYLAQLAAAILSNTGSSAKGLGSANRLLRFAQDVNRSLGEVYFRKSTAGGGDLLAEILKPEIFNREQRFKIQRDFCDGFNAAAAKDSPLRKILTMDAKFYLPNDLLTKVDRASMAHSLELRVPFLDHRLAEFVFGLPDHFKLRGQVTKYILREVMKNKLPAAVLRKPKHGFSLPLDSWLRSSWRKEVERRLLDPQNKCFRYLNHSSVTSMWHQCLNGETNLCLSLWSLLAFEEWCQQHLP